MPDAVVAAHLGGSVVVRPAEVEDLPGAGLVIVIEPTLMSQRPPHDRP